MHSITQTPPHTDPIDWRYLEVMRERHIGHIADNYFRAEMVGADSIRDTGPLIIAPNHSGNAMPYDAIILDFLLWRKAGFAREAKCRSVFAPALTAATWMRPFAIDNWWRRVGGVDMTFKNFEALLQSGHRVIYYPEGVPGIGKGFRKRYQLQHFHTSFVVLGARLDVPVNLVSIVNAEWLNPLSFTSKKLNTLAQRFLRIPFLPMPAALLGLLFPFVFYMGFPARLVFVVHEPIDMRERLRAAGETNFEAPSREVCLEVAEQLRREAQGKLDSAVATSGERPWDLGGLIRSLRTIPGRALRSTPLGWPYAFVQSHRDLYRDPPQSAVHRIVRDLDVLANYVPFGWPLIALLRRLRRPPYGNRGLSAEEIRSRSGRYVWEMRKMREEE